MASKKRKKETGKPICKLKPEEQVLSGDSRYINPKHLLENAPESARIKKQQPAKHTLMFGGIPLK